MSWLSRIQFFLGVSLVFQAFSSSVMAQPSGGDDLAPGTVRTHSVDQQEYAWVPPGSFMMGCVPDDPACDEDEEPRHKVVLSTGFWMGRTEVTAGAYEKFATTYGHEIPDPPDFNPGWTHKDQPIVRVSWEEALSYCAWAGGRLPTEAEYEYAARAGHEGLPYWWGEEPSRDHANYEGTGGRDRWENTAPVGHFAPNDYGLYDLAGNVWEWTGDWYHALYYSQAPEADPPGPERGVERVLRGGSWFTLPRVLRASDRFKYVAPAKDNSLGFRCVSDVLP